MQDPGISYPKINPEAGNVDVDDTVGPGHS